VVRRYTASADRAGVRRVCYETGYMGEPIDWQWRDAESFADIFSSYYTDAEPGSAFVVERSGIVCGYLLGCTDSRRAWNPGRIAGRHLLRRGLAFRPGTAPVIWRTMGDTVVDLARRRVAIRDLEFSDPRWPAHLHIDLLPEARGQGVGRQLVQRWFDELDAHGGIACHLQTFAENTTALAFFESVGFERLGPPVLTPGLRSRSGARLHLQVMVQPNAEAGR
jgi:ribosomal protein S18 acetylase RimI-like enzyme